MSSFCAILSQRLLHPNYMTMDWLRLKKSRVVIKWPKYTGMSNSGHQCTRQCRSLSIEPLPLTGIMVDALRITISWLAVACTKGQNLKSKSWEFPYLILRAQWSLCAERASSIRCVSGRETGYVLPILSRILYMIGWTFRDLDGLHYRCTIVSHRFRHVPLHIHI